MIYTTRGFLPESEVELKSTVTYEDEKMVVTRVDKYVTGEWAGNDINATIKTGHEFAIEAQQLGGSGG